MRVAFHVSRRHPGRLGSSSPSHLRNPPSGDRTGNHSRSQQVHSLAHRIRQESHRHDFTIHRCQCNSFYIILLYNHRIIPRSIPVNTQPFPPSPPRFHRLQLIMARLITPRRGRDIPSSVQLARDGIGHITQLLLLLLEIFRARRSSVFVQPVGGFLDGFEEL